MDPLARYRAKRSADRTPEPSGSAVRPAKTAGGLFIVHKHAATRLHYDLRLEMDGVLRSWAVPKGPSKNPADKRLAVHVEDHPIEYGDFEGLIPEGNYGAGAVIIWDRGEWIPLEDAHEGMKKGKLLFELRGHKLQGRWTLVKLRKTPKEWLLIKERDGHVSAAGDDFPEQSVMSGRTIADLEQGTDPAAQLEKQLRAVKAKKQPLRFGDVSPMLAETREKPFNAEGWIFEPKLDGWRIIAAKDGGKSRLISRNGHDLSPTFPELTKALAALPFDGLFIDGEAVCSDANGVPSFQRLQQRALLTKPQDAGRAAVSNPATLYAFDLLGALGHDLRPLPLLVRKEILRSVLPPAGAIRFVDHFPERGEELYESVVRMGLEGILAKKADSPYRMQRSADWLKIRHDRTGDFAVIGASPPKGLRKGFGALHLASCVDGEWTYIGRVGTGFNDRQLDEISAELEKHRVGRPPARGPVPAGSGELWVEPTMVAEVRYKEWTDEGLLRQPVFVRFRSDKLPEECGSGVVGRESRVVGRESRPTTPRPTSHVPRPSKQFSLSNLDKLFYPEDGYTKGDLINYYRAIAPWMLPYLRDRCLVLTRYPDGIHGKSFFQKDAPEYAREFVKTVTVWSEDSQRELDYFVCETADQLVYIANMGAIPLHVWGSRVTTLERPDWCILDLDPKGAPFSDVVRTALVVKELLDEIELPSFVKTTGKSGLHILIPLGRQVTFEQCRTLGGLLARDVVAELPEITTIVRQVHKREGKVYVDYMQNGHGQLLVAPFSARPVPGAQVSAPLEWKEVGPKLSPADYTIRTVPARLKRKKKDPMIGVLELAPELGAALERLQARTQRRKAKRGDARRASR